MHLTDFQEYKIHIKYFSSEIDQILAITLQNRLAISLQ
jgi:hypothetical protein